MTEAKSEPILLDIKGSRAFMPNLFVPKRVKNKKGQETGEPIYTCSFRLENGSDELKAAKAACIAVARAKWPQLSKDELRDGLHWPWVDGDEMAETRRTKKNKDDNDWLEGGTVFKSKSKYQPNISIVENNKIRENIENAADAVAVSKKKVYNGADVLATVEIVAYDAASDNGKDGVTLYLKGLVFLGTGERHGGTGINMNSRFRDVVGQYTTSDPTAGSDDDDEVDF